MTYMGDKIDYLKEIWASVQPERGTFGGRYTGEILSIILANREGTNYVVGN